MADLTKEQQQLIVMRLACFVKPVHIIQELKETDNITVSGSQISYYNIKNGISSKDLSDELRELFESTRQAYIAAEEEVAISHRRYRLELLDELLEHPLVKNFPTVKQGILEQAAKERGGIYRQKQESGASVNEIESVIFDTLEQAGEKLFEVLEETIPDETLREQIDEKVEASWNTIRIPGRRNQGTGK